MDLRTVKNVAPNRHLFKKIAALIFSIIVIVVSFMVITNANKDATNTIDVLRVKTSNGLPAYAVITEDDIETYSLIKREYTEDMILADKKHEVVGMLVKYYVRQNSILYKDQLTAEKPLKNEWLYELDEDYEVLTIPYNHLELGGDVLLPGDYVRIRVSYEVEEDAQEMSDSIFNPNVAVVKDRGKSIRTDILFDRIEVKDMLNANSHSIYEVYKEVMKLSEDKRQQVMRSDDFLRSIQPRALMLAGTKEQMNNYAKFAGYNSKSFLITILSRANSDVILDRLPTLESEVASWLESQNED